MEIIGLSKQTFDFQLKSLDYLSKCWISYVNHVFYMKISTGKLWEALGGFGKLWLWEPLGGSGKLWEALGSLGKLCDVFLTRYVLKA